MRIALRELIRRPSRFLTVGGALVLLVVLLVVLGGFLDGLSLSQTGAFRAQGQQRLWVLSSDAELQLPRSRVPVEVRDAVAGVDGVADVGRLAAVSTTTTLPGSDELADVAVYGYELAGDVLPEPPAAGEVVVDRRLTTLTDIAEGDTLEVGPDATPLRVAGFVEDTTQAVPTLWADLGTWQELAATANPVAALPQGAAQALLVDAGADADQDDLDALAARIDEATGATTTVGLDELVDGQPATAQQTSVFQGIISVTFVVALLVVALFFALLTLERIPLYAVLKALGGRSGDLLRGLTVQALGISAGALALGIAIALGVVALLPPDLPVTIVGGRLAIIAVGTVVTAVVGALFTMRRILRIDPADAIG